MNSNEEKPFTLYHALQFGTQTLNHHSDSPRIDSEVILAFVLNKPRVFLFTHPEYLLTLEEQQQFSALIEARLQGHPIAYLLQAREFWSLSLRVTPHTLIPRPETELLVERALLHIESIPHAKVLDLGTGSGAIALAIAHERPDCQVVAADLSQEALEIACLNAMHLQIHNVSFCHSNWFSAFKEVQFHLIVSNPPYLENNDPHLNQGDLRFEPRSALSSGPTGLEDITTITQFAAPHLLRNGWLCIEHGYTQKPFVQALFKKFGYKNIASFQDLQGHERITEGSCF